MNINRYIIVSVILLQSVVLLPNHYQPWLSFYQEFFAFVALIGFALALNYLSEFRLSFACLFIGALPLLPLIQYSFGLIDYSGDTFIYICFLAGFAAAFIIGFQFSSNHSSRFFLCTSIAVVVLVVASLSIWVALNQWLMLAGSMWVVDLKPGDRPYANFGQPNHLATFLGMGLASLLYLFEKKYIGRFAATIFLIFIIFGIALTQSRTSWVGAFCLGGWWGYQYLKGRVSFSPLQMLGWIIIFASFVAALPLINELLYLGGQSVSQRAGQTERLIIWSQFWQALKEGGIWGYGWGQTTAAQLQVALDYPIGLRIGSSHNILLDLLLWVGFFFGVPIIIISVIWMMRIAIRAQSIEASFAFLFSGFILIHGMFEYPLEYAYFLIPLGVMLGVSAGESSNSVIVVGVKKTRWIITLSIFSSFLVLSWIWIEYRKIEDGFQQMRFDRANIGSPKPWPEDSSIVLLTQLDAQLRAAYITIDSSMTLASVDELCRVAHREPYPKELFRCGLAKGYKGDVDGAAREILIIESLHRQRSFMWAYTELQNQSMQSPELTSVLTEIDRVRPTIKLRYQPDLVGH